MQCEVLVVGGGPAGSTAARLLAKEGIDTVLIEKNLYFNKPCGGGIPSAGLKDFDLLNEIQIPFNRIKKVKIFPPFSEPIEVELKPDEIFIFSRSLLDPFLRGLAEKKGVKLIEAELINIENYNKKYRALIRKRSNETEKITCRYIIAADGVNSRVCKITGVSRPDYFWTVSLHVPENMSENRDTCEFWFGSSHASFFYSWVFPAVDYLSVGTGAEDVCKLKNFIQNFLKKRFDEKINTDNFKLRAYKIPRWRRKRFYKENILFCGDALGTVMPVSFEGIYYAMKSAQFAVEAIKQRNLKLYEKLWNEKFLNQFIMMKKFQDFMFGSDKKMDRWLNVHRDNSVQELAMALWLRKKHGGELIPLYLKAFAGIISRIAIFKLK